MIKKCIMIYFALVAIFIVIGPVMYSYRMNKIVIDLHDFTNSEWRKVESCIQNTTIKSKFDYPNIVKWCANKYYRTDKDNFYKYNDEKRAIK